MLMKQDRLKADQSEQLDHVQLRPVPVTDALINMSIRDFVSIKDLSHGLMIKPAYLLSRQIFSMTSITLDN